MEAIQTFYRWFFAKPGERRSWFSVIGWWEIRRIPYNLIVGLTGIGSLSLFFLFIHLARGLEPGEDAVEPLALISAPFVINVAYTTGWIAELFLRIVWKEKSPDLGPAFLKLGLSFSLFIIFLPSFLWFTIWIFRSVAD